MIPLPFFCCCRATRTGENGSIGLGFRVEVAGHHLPDAEIEREAKTLRQHMVHIDARCDDNLLGHVDNAMPILGCVHLPDVAVVVGSFDGAD